MGAGLKRNARQAESNNDLEYRIQVLSSSLSRMEAGLESVLDCPTNNKPVVCSFKESMRGPKGEKRKRGKLGPRGNSGIKGSTGDPGPQGAPGNN